MSNTYLTRLSTLFGALSLVFAGSAAADQSHTVVAVAAANHSDPITVPGPYLPVAMVCASRTTANANPGLGNASLFRSGALTWTGYDFATRSVVGGTETTSIIQHIVYCDAQSAVEVQAVSPTQIRVNNSSGAAVNVDVMFIF